MRFKIDENLPSDLAEMLKHNGHNAFTVNQQKMQGTKDDDLIKICKAEKRALITLDTDFSDIRRYPPKEYYGIIVLRCANQSKTSIMTLMRKILTELKKEKVIRELWIVEDDKIRIR
jgi:predicted nuclease of predicted toxin-antitoxin system